MGWITLSTTQILYRNTKSKQLSPVCNDTVGHSCFDEKNNAMRLEPLGNVRAWPGGSCEDV
jgi:hypothetical protein